MSFGLNRGHRNRDRVTSGVTGAHTHSPHNKILVLSSSPNKTVAETNVCSIFKSERPIAAHLTVSYNDSKASAVC